MSDIKISVLCPTRRRMSWMRRLAKSCFDTCYDKKQVEIVFGIDDDDHESIETAKDLQKEYSEHNIVYTVWPRKKYVFSDLINQVSYVANGQIFNLVGDDAKFMSKNWDEIVLQEFDKFEDKIVMVHVNDGQSIAPRLACHPFMHANWRDAVGYLLPPYFHGDWADYWITDVVREISSALGQARKVYQPNIFIEHLHPELGKAEKDETYYEHLIERTRPDAAQPYKSDEGQKEIQQNIKDLLAFIDNFGKENE